MRFKSEAAPCSYTHKEETTVPFSLLLLYSAISPPHVPAHTCSLLSNIANNIIPYRYKRTAHFKNPMATRMGRTSPQYDVISAIFPTVLRNNRKKHTTFDDNFLVRIAQGAEFFIRHHGDTSADCHCCHVRCTQTNNKSTFSQPKSP